jgi:hypothetical protein
MERRVHNSMNKALFDYYQCPEEYLDFRIEREHTNDPGYFKFGPNTICFGSLSSGKTSKSLHEHIHDITEDIKIVGKVCYLPFDPTSVVDNLRLERYVDGLHKNLAAKGIIRDLYYALRPMMPVRLRKHLQRRHFRGWENIRFPQWPLDRTVERVFQGLMKLAIKARGATRIPFVWFWPEGFRSCAIVTHDVESAAGLDSCNSLMDIDDSYNIKSSFQLIPQGRYSVSSQFLRDMRSRGFETNIHDLTHDGHLYNTHSQFVLRAQQINIYAKEFEAKGFRSGQLYRNQEWYENLDFSYDMSVPNVAHLDPQRGGCCTVTPYFIGEILELPVTTTQDYQYIHILGHSTIEPWKQQIALILECNGLASFLAHPDYLLRVPEQNLYKMLLAHLSDLRANEKMWIALPREVDTWWRLRSQMRIVQEGTAWKITGPGSERARLVYASLSADNLVYRDEQDDEINKFSGQNRHNLAPSGSRSQ